MKLSSNDAIEDGSFYHKRIEAVLDIYQGFIQHRNELNANDNNTDDADSIYEKISKFYHGKIDGFMMDYVRLVSNENADDKYIVDSGCNIDKCEYIGRGYRNIRRLLDGGNKSRKELYHREDKEINIVLSQILDSMHNLIHHSYDMGFKLKPNDIKEIEQQIEQKQSDNNNNDNNDDEEEEETKGDDYDDDEETNTFNLKFDKIKKLISSRKHHFETIRPDLKNDDTKADNTKNEKVNKFVINTSGKFSFGKRFHYHPYYKINGEEERGKIGRIFEQDWFITAKYKTLKEELLNNNIFTLTLWQWMNTITKAKLKWNQYKENKDIVSKSNTCWTIAYGIDAGEIIKLEHIMCVLLYTNWTNLCFYFSASYRKLRDDESDQELKQRHTEYAIWGKLLRETVEVYGTKFGQSSIKKFYTGISTAMLFESFSASICCPLSTAAS